jgi:hypothetical protein
LCVVGACCVSLQLLLVFIIAFDKHKRFMLLSVVLCSVVFVVGVVVVDVVVVLVLLLFVVVTVLFACFDVSIASQV